MPEPDEEVTDAKADVVVPRPLTASRLAALCVAGLLRGFAGAVDRPEEDRFDAFPDAP